MEEESLSFGNFFRVIKKRKKLIIIISILTTIIASIVNFYMLSPVYEARTTIIIGKNDEYKYDDVMMYQNLIKTYAEIANSDDVATKTVKKLENRINVNLEDINKDVKVNFKEGTQILNITVQREYPNETISIINTFTDSFIEKSKSLIPNGKIEIVDTPILPQKPIKPNRFLNIIISLFIAIITSTSMAFMIEYLDDTIKSQEDVEKKLGLSVIGIIPKNINK